MKYGLYLLYFHSISGKSGMSFGGSFISGGRDSGTGVGLGMGPRQSLTSIFSLTSASKSSRYDRSALCDLFANLEAAFKK